MHRLQCSAEHGEVGRPHAVGVDHGLGKTRGARREQEFDNRIAIDFGEGLVNCACGRGCQEIVQQHGAAALRRISGYCEPAAGWQASGERSGKGIAVIHENEAGRQLFKDVAQFAKVFRHKRVGWGHRAPGNADIKAGHRNERMIDAVARKDRYGTLRPEIELQQGLADCTGRGQHLRVSDFAPAAARRALGDENGIGRFLRPMDKPVAKTLRVIAQGVFVLEVD